MTTYTDYLRDRVLAASVSDQGQLEHLIHAERNIFWQRLVANPAYDERGRLSALAAFDEAAGVVFAEQTARFSRTLSHGSLNSGPPGNGPSRHLHPHNGPLQGLGAGQSLRPHAATPASEPETFSEPEPGRRRSFLRDLVFLLIGILIGFVVAYFVLGGLTRVLAGGSTATPAVEGLTASQKSFKFVKSNPSDLAGEVKVDYANGARPKGFQCKVEATNKQILEYVRFDSACQTVSFKFLPLPTLWDNFNYLEGYMVFSTTITSAAGKSWEGSASVYFKIDGTA